MALRIYLRIYRGLRPIVGHRIAFAISEHWMAIPAVLIPLLIIWALAGFPTEIKPGQAGEPPEECSSGVGKYEC